LLDCLFEQGEAPVVPKLEIHRVYEVIRLDSRQHLLGFVGIERQRFLAQHMPTSPCRLQHHLVVKIGRRGNADKIDVYQIEHAAIIVESLRNSNLVCDSSSTFESRASDSYDVDSVDEPETWYLDCTAEAGADEGDPKRSGQRGELTRASCHSRSA